jgi:outer membrane protein assembly factor BamB
MERLFGKKTLNGKASGSNSSPVTDGKSIFVYFKSGDFASVSPSGEVLWSLNIQEKYGEDTLWWDLGTSPVLTENAVVVTVMQTGPSFLVALDKTTGKEIWKADRWLNVREEANQSYTTPAIAKLKQGDAFITVGADHVTAHATADGKLLWKLGGFNPKNDAYFRSISSPVVLDGIAFCPYARGGTLTAVRTDVELADDKRILWRNDFGSDVPTPAIYQGKLYLLGDKGLVTCLKPDTGETLWSQQLPKSNRQYSSSPIIANGHVYCVREDAMTFVLAEDPSGTSAKVVSENKLPGDAVATPVFANERIYLRTFDSLYCIK